MVERLKSKRVLIYSHDSFGLGHLRRCRAIAHALVERFKGLTVLILSGSPIIANFEFRARVDFVRIPGVIKLYNGEYTSLGLHIDLKDTLSIRESIIRQTARTFAPDIFLVDKEPLGLKGEVAETLKMLKSSGTHLVMGLRDVMDEPLMLKKEWTDGEAISAMENLYDEIWVYGTEAFVDPLDGIDIPPVIREKMNYTGYLRRSLPKDHEMPRTLDTHEPYVLVTPGGGGDGVAMVDWVMRAYERNFNLPLDALIVLGPFMSLEQRTEFMERAEKLKRVTVITFDARLEVLMANSECVVSMAGYNTFCEILSYDKPALLVPRTEPRKEQLVRALRAQELGLVSVLVPDEFQDASVMADALRKLPDQLPPSENLPERMLEGLNAVGDIVHDRLGGGVHEEFQLTNER